MSRLLTLTLLALLIAPAASAQNDAVSPRFGVGFDAIVVPPGQGLLPSGVALGVRGRAALPVNADLSVAASLGIAANPFSGGDDATTVATPQGSLIVTLPGSSGSDARYLLGGFGGYVPLSGGRGGASIHAGIGWARALNETSLYVELNPALVIGSEATTIAVPARVGVIF